MDSVKSLLMIVGWGIGYFLWNAPLVMQLVLAAVLAFASYKWLHAEDVTISGE